MKEITKIPFFLFFQTQNLIFLKESELFW